MKKKKIIDQKKSLADFNNKNLKIPKAIITSSKAISDKTLSLVPTSQIIRKPKVKSQVAFLRAFPRSGTNWLCNLLNLHPSIKSEGEFHLEGLFDGYKKYKNAKYGILKETPQLLRAHFFRFVKQLVKTRCENAPICVDRTPVSIKSAFVPGSKYIYLTRDGRDVLVSWCYHALRLKMYQGDWVHKNKLFEEDPNYFEINKHELLDKEQFVRNVAKAWNNQIFDDLKYLKKADKGRLNFEYYRLKYEDLSEDTEKYRAEIYQFFGLDHKLAKPLNDLTVAGFKREKDVMNNSHYRRGKVGTWREYFTKKQLQWFNDEAMRGLKLLGLKIEGDTSYLPVNPLVRFRKELKKLPEDKPIIICVSHEASRTGAPLIILKLMEQLKQYLDVSVISLLGYGGEIKHNFESIGPTYQFKNWHSLKNYNSPEEIGLVLNILKRFHPIGAIANSAESRVLIPHLIYRCIPTIALIHEMGNIYPKGAFKKIAEKSDLTIFPSQIVKDLANENSLFPKEKTKIRGQGLLKPEILKMSRNKAKAKIRKLLGLPENAFIVLSCGSLTRRKGPQFFVNTAIHVVRQSRKKEEPLARNKSKKTDKEKREIHFVWLGGKHPRVQENFKWMKRDIATTKTTDYIHFVNTCSNPEDYFVGSDVFFMTSRADPFPCVIHEAMAAQLPIIGFKNAGGFSEALKGGCGVLVDYADTHAVAKQIFIWYKFPKKAEAIGIKAKNRVITKYKYLDYTLELAEDLMKVAQLKPVDSKATNLEQFISNLTTIKKEKQNVDLIIKKTKKIIFTVPAWELSGVNVFIEKLVQQLINKGYDAYILFTSNHLFHAQTPAELLPKVPYRFLGVDSSDFKNIWNKLKNHLEAEGPCIFVPNYDYFASAISPGLPDNVGILGVLHSDDTEHYEHTYLLGHYWNKIVAVSQTIENKLLQLNPSFKEKSSVIYYGLDAPIKRRKPRKGKKLSIIYTGRIAQEQKRILDFIPIIENLDKKKVDFVFTFIGDGPDFEALKNGLDKFIAKKKVRLLGRQPSETVYEELKKAHVIALFSDFEGLPLSLIEALSFHCVPVVTAVESGISEIIQHKENGLISPLGDIDAFVDNLVLISKDTKLKNKLAQNTFQTLTTYQLRQEDMANQYIKLIEEIFTDIEKGTFKRPQSINASNILLPSKLQVLPSKYDKKGKLI